MSHTKPGNHCNELRHSYFYRIIYFPYSFWDCHSVVYHKTSKLKLGMISCKTATFWFYFEVNNTSHQVEEAASRHTSVLEICYHQASDGRGCRRDWLMMFEPSVNKNSLHWWFMSWSQWGDGNEPRIVQFLFQKILLGCEMTKHLK